jgi:hydroxymethylpyrimidine pyrophosphatase-like HAD family hydrolase
MRPTLIAVDLDGTCVRYEPRLEPDPVFLEAIRDFLADGGRWLMNSDRPVEHMREMAEALPPEDRPVAILSRQQDIWFHGNRNGYEPHDAWNRAQLERHAALWAALGPKIEKWREEIETAFPVAERYVNEVSFAFRVPTEHIEPLREKLRACISPYPEAQVSGNDVWSFILHADFSKARVLREAAKRLEVAPESIIAVGDGINDISMLNGEVTPMVGCPGNSAPEVVSAVKTAGGYVASGESARGTAEVIRHYLGRAD